MLGATSNSIFAFCHTQNTLRSGLSSVLCSDKVSRIINLMNKITMDESAIKLYGAQLALIFKAMGNPLPSAKHGDYGHIIKKHTYKDGKINLPKIMRNAIGYQILVAMLDRIKNIVFTHQYVNREVELKSPKFDEDFLDVYFIHELIFLNIQSVNSVINFLAYYFDIGAKDTNLDLINIRNYLYIYDPEICIQLEKHILDKDSFIKMQDLFEQLINNCLSTPQMTRSQNATKSTFSIRGIYSQHFSKEDTLRFSQEITEGLYGLLEFLSKHILKHYSASQGFNSINDRVSKIDPDTGRFIDDSREYIERSKKKQPIKIYNLTSDNPTEIKSDVFVIHKNRTFNDLKSHFHRSGHGEKFEFSFNVGRGTKAKKTILQAQEGGLFWTHTLIFLNENCDESSKLIATSTLSEDVCLILSLLTGQGIYTEKSAIRYSHKSRMTATLMADEIESALCEVLTKCDEIDERERLGLGLALEQYREAMQPMSANLRLVRIWAIIEALADFYCINSNKELPQSYTDKKSLKTALRTQLKSIGECLDVNLMGDDSFVSITMHKSIKRKILDMLDHFAISEDLKVNRNQLKARLTQTYRYRNMFTHSLILSLNSEKEVKQFSNYYQFVGQLIFILFLKIFDIKDKTSINQIYEDLTGFIKRDSYYSDKQERLSKKAQDFEEFFKYLSGEKEIPPGETTFKF